MSEVWKERVAAFFRWPGRKARGCPRRNEKDSVGGSVRSGADRGDVGGRDRDPRGCNWRIYRLPGSKEWWLIDHGPGGVVLFCKHWESLPSTRDAENPTGHPRAWIAVSGILYLEGEKAVFV